MPDCDYIISNPPYSLKGKILKRLYEIGKPFAMLINFQGIFDHKERFQMFKENRVEMLWLSPRVNYIGENGEQAVGHRFKAVISAVEYATSSWNLNIWIWELKKS
ncbi:MAG: hypothetical protein ACLTZM_08440 [Ruminococcus sp.]